MKSDSVTWTQPTMKPEAEQRVRAMMREAVKDRVKFRYSTALQAVHTHATESGIGFQPLADLKRLAEEVAIELP